MKEIEAHFLEIDVDQTVSKLESLGAQKISDSVLQEMIFDKPDRSWNKTERRIRIRTIGDQASVTYKEQVTKNELGGTIEIESEISDPEAIREILEKCGLIIVRRQEKRRISYKLGGVTFDIDFWPKLPPYLEIESTDEDKVKAAAAKLGLDWSKAIFLDAKQIYQEIYHIAPIDNVKTLTFEKWEWRDGNDNQS